ncbi:MAG: hypothetical protein R3F34_14225 [Planctomycetota bacterium]
MDPIVRDARRRLVETLRDAFERDERVRALWEAGSAAFDREDEWSDVDLYALVRDGELSDVLDLAEEALRTLGPIDLRWEPAGGAFARTAQRFLRVATFRPTLFVDLLTVESGGLAPLLERELHGEPRVLFDRDGVVVAASCDAEAVARNAERMRRDLDAAWPLFLVLVEKELGRGNLLGALGFWHGAVLPRLHRRLRLERCPARATFGAHYARVDLGDELADELEALALVASADDLRARIARADALHRRASGAA